MKRLKKKIVWAAFVVMAAMLSCLLAMALGAVGDEAADSYIIADFTSGYAGWSAGDNVRETYLVDFAAGDPDGEDQTRPCLEVASHNVDVNLIRGAYTVFSEPLDLSEYRKLSYDIYAIPYELDPDAEYYTRLTLFFADGESMEHLEKISGGEWNHIEADISSWDGRESIVGAEISLTIGTSVKELNESNFYIDDILASDKVDREMTARFLFDLYTAEGGTVTLSGDKSMLTMMPAAGAQMTIEAPVFMPDFTYDANCLRIKLANHTNNDTLTLYYSTLDTQVLSEYKSVTLKIEPQSDETYYYAYIGNASMLRSIKLLFGAGSGRIELYSISAVSAYDPDEYVTCGAISSCLLGDDLLSVNFSGSVNREEALGNQSGHIAIYCWNSDKLPTPTELSELVPLVTSPMTTKFDLTASFDKNDTTTAHSAFLAVSIRPDGRYTLIAPPFYISNPERTAAISDGFAAGAKGFAASDLSLVGDSGTGVTLLEIEVPLAFASKSEGVRFIYKGAAYYFDGDYFDTLAGQIRALADVGTDVLLRYYDWSLELADELARMLAEDEYVSYSTMANEPDGSDFLGALSAYTAELWLADGSVCGVILGEGENIVDGEVRSMDEMVRRTADDLRTIYYNFAAVNADARVYVSVSDLYTSDPATGNTEFGLCEFIPALIAETAKNGQFGWEIAIENIYRIKHEEGSEYVLISDCSRMVSLLAENGCADKHLIFCDSTYSSSRGRVGTALASFVESYYHALFHPSVDAYIASAGSRGTDIYEAVRYIDTTDADTIVKLALSTMDTDDFADIIDGWDEDELPQRRITSYDATEEAPAGIKGRFRYYTFDTFTGSSELTASYYAASAAVVDDGGGAALSVRLDSSLYGGSGIRSWMGIAHRFAYAENLKLTPVLALTLKVDEISPASLQTVPVKLVLLGGGDRFESTAEIPAGQWVTLYVYTGDFSEAYDTECIQLLVGGSKLRSATLQVRSIDGLSREYNDESLESVIADARLKKRSPEEAPSYTAYMWIGGAIIIAVATVLAVVLLSRKKGDSTK